MEAARPSVIFIKHVPYRLFKPIGSPVKAIHALLVPIQDIGSDLIPAHVIAVEH